MFAKLLQAVESLLLPFIRAADTDRNDSRSNAPEGPLLEQHSSQALVQLLDLKLPMCGQGKEGLISILEPLLKYSVNTWNQGFLDKLYASTNAVGSPPFHFTIAQDSTPLIHLMSQA